MRGATASKAMEKSLRVRVIERKEVRTNDSIKHFFPAGVKSTF